ncbi:3-hydroxy-3-methylglutaryl-coenzyme A reductase [Saccharicrinis carchari]|uniref:3-hydroxy-3-methylglutaryl-coenzyme A reductase n=1 Tax=Saccharicrinis carchari TaxID=1168039 RepID=A0A521AH41_SACCC|nr:hydroxymethylglutaryl-CoA reductase [Saccharicrinis carchari]SMO34058.1 3-hydroxy-3-methylglutaryl-coenzyme A reductase [Saccharicrinis carchari]
MIKGFSKFSQEQKVDTLAAQFNLPVSFKETLRSHHHRELQGLYNQFAENTISNFYLPYNVAPGFVINKKEYAIPMVVEESSVVAAASKAAKFWSAHGGFSTKVLSVTKSGQLFFTTEWSFEELSALMPDITSALRCSVGEITHNMEKRGGGITGFKLTSESLVDEQTYCLMVSFETADSMGANFINTCLEKMGDALVTFLIQKNDNRHIEINMAILSNYTPECLVQCALSCPIEDLQAYSGVYSPQDFALRFKKAVSLAKHNPSRAVTHNKGIMNGIDAVVLATGNDFRAIEAGVHAYASRAGAYASLTDIVLENDTFTYTLKLPLALGTVGGLTSLHPMAKLSLLLLDEPSASELMQIVAAAGMANNFSAVAALVTSGIQKGHMKMHLSNILAALNADPMECQKAKKYFSERDVSHSAVKLYLDAERLKNKRHEY